MDDLINLYWDLLDIANINGDEIANIFSIHHSQEPATFFAKAYNQIKLVIEILDNYNRLWAISPPATMSATTVENIRQENRKRIEIVTSLYFISIMSSLEYSAKISVIKQWPELKNPKRDLYFSTIIKESNRLGIIDNEKFDLWDGAIKLRNSLAHNNGISRETKTYSYPGFTLSVNEGRAPKVHSIFFGLLTKWILQESKLWFIKINLLHKSS